MRKLLLNPTPLFRKLRQLSMLLTLLLALPQTAIGATETVTKTITLNKTVDETNFPEGQYLTTGSITLPVTITENGAPYNGQITIKSASISSYSSDANGAVFKMKGGNNADEFAVMISGNYPKIPSSATVKAAYTNCNNNNGYYFSIGIDETVDQGNTHNYNSTVGPDNDDIEAEFTGDTNDGKPNTNRDYEGELYVYFYINAIMTPANEDDRTTVTIKEISFTYERDTYGLTIGNTVVKSDNRKDVLGDGKVSFTPAATVNDINVLTLNGANIEITTDDAIKSTMSAPLYVNIVGDNTISCNGHYAFNASNHLTFQTSGTTSGSLTITNTSGVTPSTFYSLPTDVTPTYENSLGAEQSGTNTVIISTAATTIHWPNAATPDKGTVNITTTNGTELDVTYAATTSFSFPLSLPSGSTSTVAYSSNSDVATVNASTGDVTIVKAGDATITATVNGTNVYTYLLTVKKAIATIAFSANDYFYVNQGATKAIPVTTTPLKDDVTGEDILLEYNIVGSTGITIDNTARTITAASDATIGQFDSYIDFSSNANYKRADETSAPRCSLKVVAAATPLEIKYKIGDAEVTSFEKTFGSAETLPALSVTDGYRGDITYESSNTDVAAIGVSGTVTIIASGETVITATAPETETYSGGTASYTLTVHKATPTISFAKWNETNQDYTGGNVGASETLQATYGTTFKAPMPTFNNGYILSDSTKYVYSYSVDDVVVFPNNGENNDNPGKINYGEINLLKSGTVTITCSFPGNMQNNPCSASYTLQVNKADANLAYNETTSNAYIDLSGNGQWGVPNGTGGTAPTLTKPTNVTGITYTSSNTNVATVSSTGDVTPIGAGEATITATLSNNDSYNDGNASYQLTVMVPATISFANATASVLNKVPYTQAATTDPAGATITYSSSDNNNVRVDANGQVTIINQSFYGPVTITATLTAVPAATPQLYYVLADEPAFQATYTLNVAKNFDISSIFTDASMNYATCILSEQLTKPDGLKVYYITGTNGNTVTTQEIDYLPYGIPILLEKTAATIGSVTARTDSSSVVSGNLLQYATSDVSATGNQYVLYKNEFVKATGTIPTGKCYLYLTGVSGARGMYGIGNDGSTAIEGIDVEATKDEEWYDLQGRRIQQPMKAGIYIVNGKKVIINKK